MSNFGYTNANVNNREKRSILFFGVGLSVTGVGVATGSHSLTFAGLFAIAVTIRYRKRPPFWHYVAFLILGLVIVALVPPSSPLIGAIPLMVSYVLDYIDEQRQKRTAQPPAQLLAGTTNVDDGLHATLERGAVDNQSPSTRRA